MIKIFIHQILKLNQVLSLNENLLKNSSTIITTNKPFKKWENIFADIALASAIIDRLVNHAYLLKVIEQKI